MRGGTNGAGAAFDGVGGSGRLEARDGRVRVRVRELKLWGSWSEACVLRKLSRREDEYRRLGFLQEVPRPVSQYRSC